MGADAVAVFYGVRLAIDDANELEALHRDEDERLARASKAKLHTMVGRLTAGAPHFLLIGTEIGLFGVEGGHQVALADAQLASIMAKTRRRLRRAGFREEPALHVQLMASF